MSNYDLIVEAVRYLRFNLEPRDITVEMIADAVNETPLENDRLK